MPPAPVVPAPEQVTALALTLEHVHSRLEGGVPQLRDVPVQIAPRAFRQLWQRVCSLRDLQHPDAAGRNLAEAMRSNQLDPAGLIDAILAGQPERVRQQAEMLGLDPVLTTTVLRFTLYPFFTAIEPMLAVSRAESS
jgi:hypothetical protein